MPKNLGRTIPLLNGKVNALQEGLFQ